MTSPSAPGPPSEPVRIEVPTTKVDATLDLVKVIESVAAGAERVSAAQARGDASAARLPAGADEHLSAIGDLARQLAARLSAVESDAPQLRAAIEHAAASDAE